MNLRPVFIFSLPRSGSTLLQRILTSHRNIASVSEPWLLLPLFYNLNSRGVFAEYAHINLVQATQDLIHMLPEGENDYYKAIRSFAMHIYQKLSGEDIVYFIDKTPRYHLIIDKIFQSFPEAKFIFLWRQPLAVAASIMTMTNPQGTWKNLHRYRIDLYEGLDNLISNSVKYQDQSITITYEQLVKNPEETLNSVANYLEIDFQIKDIEIAFTTPQLKGNLGDIAGYLTYNKISMDSLGKWKTTMRSPLRKKWCERYLDWIGDSRLRQLGYQYSDILETLNSTKTSYSRLYMDVIEYFSYGMAYSIFDPSILKYKIRSRLNHKRTYPLF